MLLNNNQICFKHITNSSNNLADPQDRHLKINRNHIFRIKNVFVLWFNQNFYPLDIKTATLAWKHNISDSWKYTVVWCIINSNLMKTQYIQALRCINASGEEELPWETLLTNLEIKHKMIFADKPSFYTMKSRWKLLISTNKLRYSSRM